MTESALQVQKRYLHIQSWAQTSAIVRGSYAESTLRNYQTRANQWVGWAEANGVCVFPVQAKDLATFLMEATGGTGEGTRGAAWARQCLSMMRLAHRVHDLPTPTEDEKIRLVMRGLARHTPRARQAPPLRQAEWDFLRQHLIARQKGFNRIINIRDAALIGLMRHGLLRQSEVCALNWEDWDGEVLHIRRSKTDPTGNGAQVYVPKETRTDIKKWHELLLPPVDGSLFRSLGRGGKIKDTRIPDRNIADIINHAVVRAGMIGSYSGHSCRVGMAMDLADAGFSVTKLQLAGRWQGSSMPAYYARGIMAKEGAVAQYCGEKK